MVPTVARHRNLTVAADPVQVLERTYSVLLVDNAQDPEEPVLNR